jgi:hypothetical protein
MGHEMWSIQGDCRVASLLAMTVFYVMIGVKKIKALELWVDKE